MSSESTEETAATTTPTTAAADQRPLSSSSSDDDDDEYDCVVGRLLPNETAWTNPANGEEYRLQTQTHELTRDTTVIRSLDWDRDRFDIEFGLEKGTTYNSYVIKGKEKTVLIDTSHEKFEQLYLSLIHI